MTEHHVAHGEESGEVVLGIGLKAYLGVEASAEWSSRVATVARTHPAIVNGKVTLFVLPTLASLPVVRSAFSGTRVKIGAQDLSEYDRGAYTGAISGADLSEIGCEYVEIGHAERRRHFGEDDAEIARKLAAAVRNELTPVLCVGEPEEVTTSEAAAICMARLDLALADAEAQEHPRRIIVAYEPEWAIGREHAADPDHVKAVIEALRVRLRAHAWLDAHLLYGGSAQLGTLSGLGRGVDGLFLGRFAHDTENLAQIIDEAAAFQSPT